MALEKHTRILKLGWEEFNLPYDKWETWSSSTPLTLDFLLNKPSVSNFNSLWTSNICMHICTILFSSFFGEWRIFQFHKENTQKKGYLNKQFKQLSYERIKVSREKAYEKGSNWLKVLKKKVALGKGHI